ncbi:MAG TPA: M20/M25/M40 family metallo-hydrolase [Kofleriaceae bacterium]|nr:M20/M25/M40 family metallo-hydrolase [Kofleriaceae bacterium]
MARFTIFTVVALAGCAPLTYEAATPAWVNDTSTLQPKTPTPIADTYREVAATIIKTARSDRGAYAKLSELTDKVGNRLAGSAALDKAIDWATKTLAADRITVKTEKVMVPHWTRGTEAAAVMSPVSHDLRLLALGGSVATPKPGLTAPVVVVHDWAELDAKAEQVKGAIVVYNVPMPAYSEQEGSGYGKTVAYRTQGASRAAKKGAVAALVRSVTAHSLGTPHTGAMHYDDDAPKIPTAAIAVEDAELIDRLATKGPVTIWLRLDTATYPDAESANVIGELKGSTNPDEVVVIGAHLDSWDVGQGAHDDGAGVVTMMQALQTLAKLGLHPRRTIRVVLFTNEENGLRGGKTYAEVHAKELPSTVFALEADSGGFPPRGFTVSHKDEAAATRMRGRLADITSLLHELGAMTIRQGGGGADISPMGPAGVPQAGLEVDGRTYFDYHHTEADTLDKVKPQDLSDMVAAIAVVAYVVADMPDRVDAP